jgi:hypothetical protein
MGIIILNPLTNSNEIIYYPLNIQKLYYYQTLVSEYYKIVIRQLITNQEKESDHEEMDEKLLQLKRENDRLKQKSRDLQRHNQILQHDLTKMDPTYQPSKLPKIIKPGTVIFPPGFEVDETMDIQFGYD